MKISANYYTISPRKFIAGTKGSYGMEKLEISFSEEWSALSKKVIFYPPNSEAVSVIYNGIPIDIPNEVMRVRGRTKYAIVGYEGRKKLLTLSGEIDVLNTVEDTDTSSQRPTQSEISQVLGIMKTTTDVANSIRSDADNGVFNGKEISPAFLDISRGNCYTMHRNIKIPGGGCNNVYLFRILRLQTGGFQV